MPEQPLINEILHFWFGELDERGMSAPERDKVWFRASPDFDAETKRRFGAAVEAALDGKLDEWAGNDEGLVALVLLLDQFTRSIYRDTPAAFSGDAKALALSRAAVAAGRDASLPPIHRLFLYLPFEHAEDLEAQDTAVSLLRGLLADCAAEAQERVAVYVRYAEAHRDVIRCFGRFPHRNSILGRETTPTEQEHLVHHGGF